MSKQEKNPNLKIRPEDSSLSTHLFRTRGVGKVDMPEFHFAKKGVERNNFSALQSYGGFGV